MSPGRHLRTQYYSDSPFSFVHQLHCLLSMGTQYETSKPVSDFIDKFETPRALLLQLSASEISSYRMKLNRFLACDEAKRDILLSMLIPSMTNIIDNISTKPSMTYAEARQRLVSLPSNQSYDGDAALVVKRAKYNNKRKLAAANSTSSASSKSFASPASVNANANPATAASTTKTKSCSYCKKHGHPHLGHTWWECQFLLNGLHVLGFIRSWVHSKRLRVFKSRFERRLKRSKCRLNLDPLTRSKRFARLKF